MTLNPAIRTNIRDQKVQSIDSIIDTSSQEGMISMNTSLLNLYNAGLISEKTAYSYTTNPDNLGNKLYYLGKRKTGGEINENEIAPDLKKAIKDKKKNKKAMSKEALSNLASAPSNDDAAYSGKWDDDWNDGDDWGDEKPETPEKPERSEKIDKSEKKDVKKEPAEKPAKEDKADKIRLLLDGSADNAAAPKKHGLFGKKK